MKQADLTKQRSAADPVAEKDSGTADVCRFMEKILDSHNRHASRSTLSLLTSTAVAPVAAGQPFRTKFCIGRATF